MSIVFPNRSSSKAKALILIGTLVGIGGLGYWSGGRVKSATASAPTVANEPTQVGSEKKSQGYVTRDELSALRVEMRAEFREVTQALGALQSATTSAANAAAAKTTGAASEGNAESAPDENQIREYDKSKTVIQGALRTGTWSADDRRAFRASLETLPSSMRDEVISQLLVAINSDRLKPNYKGPPF